MSQAILDSWADAFGRCRPFGPVLREAHCGASFRIHNFVSHRWPESEADEKSVVELHRELCDRLFGQSTDIVLMYSERCEIAEEDSISLRINQKPYLKDVNLSQCKELRLEDEEYVDRTFAVVCQFSEVNLDLVSFDSANDQISQIVIADLERRIIYAPYDGGIDLVVFDDQLRSELRDRYLRMKLLWFDRKPSWTFECYDHETVATLLEGHTKAPLIGCLDISESTPWGKGRVRVQQHMLRVVERFLRRDFGISSSTLLTGPAMLGPQSPVSRHKRKRYFEELKANGHRFKVTELTRGDETHAFMQMDTRTLSKTMIADQFFVSSHRGKQRVVHREGELRWLDELLVEGWGLAYGDRLSPQVIAAACEHEAVVIVPHGWFDDAKSGLQIFHSREQGERFKLLSSE